MLTEIEQTEPHRTAIVPQVVITPAFPPLSAAPDAPPSSRSALRIVLTWAAFGMLAAGVVTATTLWSGSLRQRPAATTSPMVTTESFTAAPTPATTAAATLPPTATAVPAAPVVAPPPAVKPPAPRVRVVRPSAPPVVRRPVPVPAPVVPPSAVNPPVVTSAPAPVPVVQPTVGPTTERTTANCGTKKRKSRPACTVLDDGSDPFFD